MTTSDPLIGALVIFSLISASFSNFKGRIAPSSSDFRIERKILFLIITGQWSFTPALWRWDVKMFTNCRFGMMGWSLIILSFAAKQKELYGLSDSMVVSVLLQLIYIGKFFVWEGGYLRSMDIMHDRAGYYICWGLPRLGPFHLYFSGALPHPSSQSPRIFNDQSLDPRWYFLHPDQLFCR